MSGENENPAGTGTTARIVIGDAHGPQIFPGRREQLDPVVDAVGDVDRAVVRHLDGVGQAELRRPFRAWFLRLRHRRVRLHFRRRGVAEGAPHALELAGVRVEDDDALDRRSRRRRRARCARVSTKVSAGWWTFSVSVLPVLWPRWPICITNFPGHRELQDHVVAGAGGRRPRPAAVATDPDEIFGVDENPVLALGPVVARTVPPQLLRSFPVASNSSTGGAACARFSAGNRPRPVQHPDVIARVGRDRGHFAKDPVVGDRRPGGIDRERRGRGVPGCWAVATSQAESAVVVATARAGSRRRAVGIMVRHCNAEAFAGHLLLLPITPANTRRRRFEGGAEIGSAAGHARLADSHNELLERNAGR